MVGNKHCLQFNRHSVKDYLSCWTPNLHRKFFLLIFYNFLIQFVHLKIMLLFLTLPTRSVHFSQFLNWSYIQELNFRIYLFTLRMRPHRDNHLNTWVLSKRPYGTAQLKRRWNFIVWWRICFQMARDNCVLLCRILLDVLWQKAGLKRRTWFHMKRWYSWKQLFFP